MKTLCITLITLVLITVFPNIILANEWEAQIAIAIAIESIPSTTPTPTPVNIEPIQPTQPAQPETTPQQIQPQYRIRTWPFQRFGSDNSNTSSVAENNVNIGDVCSLNK